ncbi:hypothetical protein TGME49_315495 [Toxoplasma gondii ME49]|uniref:Uncharacterized protein n=3 Tax=Toxoplasma gondii TaxID=5811 RepID=A0A125YHV6_TOXGV|nr:hypothetical protein TGME49_315495 [Toxoplasma gondii ME49]EPT25736.1 hypothetical protein TGME49_315495 [Toxoplasma gondii ME49]ESS35344.1 hypothetical protein TGVEG_315495 [Toxoplasma gondii VEG]KFG36848.1 hypothetical protein TGDOM2_315495 [Toxoplasma gondii GAB2-2007-GAL-DOM2]|eukprot:XP_018635326.1 hypothetical protein TGME49_315495 [Toxoplasma gondii ME49]
MAHWHLPLLYQTSLVRVNCRGSARYGGLLRMQARFSPRSVKRTATGGVWHELKKYDSQNSMRIAGALSPTPSYRVATHAAVPRRPRQDIRMRSLPLYQFPVSWLFQSEVREVGTTRRHQAKRNSQHQPLLGSNPALQHSPATITDRLSEFPSGRAPNPAWSKSAKTSTFRTKHIYPLPPRHR